MAAKNTHWGKCISPTRNKKYYLAKFSCASILCQILKGNVQITFTVLDWISTCGIRNLNKAVIKEKSLNHIWPCTYIVRVRVKIIDHSNPTECSFSPVVTSVWVIIQQLLCHFTGSSLTSPGSGSALQHFCSFFFKFNWLNILQKQSSFS